MLFLTTSKECSLGGERDCSSHYVREQRNHPILWEIRGEEGKKAIPLSVEDCSNGQPEMDSSLSFLGQDPSQEVGI